jgi:DNA-binding response OmpR family regulator
MARILSVGVLQNPLRVRNQALRGAGFEVSSCTSIAVAESLFKKNPYRAVIIGHGIRTNRRVELAMFLRENSATVKIVFLYIGSIGQAELADAVVSVEDTAQNLVSTCSRLAWGRT